MTIRAITTDDWQTIYRLECESYSDLAPESLEVLHSKWLAAPEFCSVFEKSQQVVAYLLAHPWHDNTFPNLYQSFNDDQINSIREDIEHNAIHTLFLHDLVVDPLHAGAGIGSALVSRLIDTAIKHSVRAIRLIAVEGADSFWKKHAFTVVPNRSIDRTYGDDAVLMQLTL